MGPDEYKPFCDWMNGIDIKGFTAEVKMSAPEILHPVTLLYMRHPAPKHCRCNSRKRFVKLVMGLGAPRNNAERLADGLVDGVKYPSWQAAWWYMGTKGVRYCK